MVDVLSEAELQSVINNTPTKEAEDNGYVYPDLSNGDTLVQVANGQYSSPGKYKNPWTAPFELLRDSYKLGEAPVVRGVKGFEFMLRGDMTDADERTQAAALQTQELQQLQQDVSLMKSHLGPWNFWHFTGNAANIAPSLIHTAKGGGAGGVLGAAVGAGIGALSDNPVGIRIGARTGFRIGSAGGGVIAGAQMNMGNVYLDLRDKGIPKPAAQRYAFASGALMGALEYFGLRGLGAVGRKAFAKQLATPQGQAAVKGMLEQFKKSGMFGRIAEGTATETVTEVSQELVQITTEALAQWSEQDVEVWRSPKFWQDVQQRVSETAVTTAQGSLILAGGGEVTGTVAGRATKSFKDIVRRSQREDAIATGQLAEAGAQGVLSGEIGFEDAVEALKEAFTDDTEEQKEQALTELQDLGTEELLDVLEDPATDIPTLTAGITREVDLETVQDETQVSEPTQADVALEEETTTEEDGVQTEELQTPTEIIKDEQQIATLGLSPVETQARINAINRELTQNRQTETRVEQRLTEAFEKGA